MKILNLYAGIGGNRKLWGPENEITAVEINPEIADIYKDYFQSDTVIVTDAHQYLLEHYREFDFIWASPPCQTHTRMHILQAKSSNIRTGNYLINAKYPDMKLYQEIIFLDNFFDGKYCVENVISYYEPLIKPNKIDRHFYWSNFVIPSITIEGADNIALATRGELETRFGYDLSKYKIKHRTDTILRNCVNPKIGLFILELAQNIIRKSNTKQTELF